MNTLVTGASGFAGSLLIPRLRSEGHEVRALGRDPERVRQALERELSATELAEVRIIRGDLLSGESLPQALEGVDVAYYLIHSMERSPGTGGSFALRDRIAAETFAAAAARARIGRIVYLGGLLPRADARTVNGALGAATSRHLASRHAVERLLFAAVPDSVALRASIIIGARSRSFRLLVHLVERMPVIALPSWRRFHTQPIDARDVTAMLAASARAPVGGRTLDVGGPEALTYGEIIARIADLMLVSRPALGLRISMTALTARLAAAIAGEDPELVLPLMEGLQADLLPADENVAETLNVELHSFDSAVEHAFSEWEEFETLAAR